MAFSLKREQRDYNAALRTEAAYMMFFVLAIPYAMAREGKKYEKSKTLHPAADTA